MSFRHAADVVDADVVAARSDARMERSASTWEFLLWYDHLSSFILYSQEEVLNIFI